MYRLPSQAQKVMDLYNSFNWQQLIQMPLENVDIYSNKVSIYGKTAVSFGNASYLSFHNDERVINGGIEALKKYGTIYCCSRAYTYMNLHDEFENLLENIFGLPTVSMVQTVNASLSAMQLLMLPTDVALVDMQSHSTLHSMLLLPKAMGMKVEPIMHNDMEHLERKIQQYQKEGKEKIWYVADGVYSMYGDVTPVEDLIYLLDKYDNFYLYLDDAHGMSWTGPNGAGYVWKHLPIGHQKLVMVTGFSKGFGVGGGAVICPNKEVKGWMRRAGMSNIFTTQLPNAMLGAGIEVAKIHLTDEIYLRQDQLMENIKHFNKVASKYDFKFHNNENTPIFYLIIGDPLVATELNIKLREIGFYTNIASYPAVPLKNTGIRISITNQHTFEEIEHLLANIYTLKESLSNNQLQRKTFNNDLTLNSL